MSSQELYRRLPSMDIFLAAFEREEPELAGLLPRVLVREAADSVLAACRAGIAGGSLKEAEGLELPALLEKLRREAAKTAKPRYRRVLNAAGVALHTNLGRSPLAPEAVEAATRAAAFYGNLEMNLETGERGTRYSHVEPLLCRLTGAEAALCVNNNAAAVLLVLDTLCKGREVIVSRGELVEIGGSFRVPDIMAKSGCLLKEVGTTNRTRTGDYARAVNENTVAFLKVHSSNFRVIGFTEEAPRAQLAALAAEKNVALLEDLGSGTLHDFSNHIKGVSEPTARQVLEEGTQLVTFSGDKLLGGPQAGIIAGKKSLVDAVKANPLTRALRVDKMTLAALEATLRLYLEPEKAAERIPALRMLTASAEALADAARALAAVLSARIPAQSLRTALVPGTSQAGGGAFPGCDLPTTLVRLEAEGLSAQGLKEALLRTEPPVVVRIADDAVCLDPRALLPEEYGPLAEAVEAALVGQI